MKRKKDKKNFLDQLQLIKRLLEGLKDPENRDLLQELCTRIGLDPETVFSDSVEDQETEETED